jgi:predicted nucleotidyltransferase
MDMRDEWIRDLGAWASQNGNVRELWLFGSRADGRSKPDSDVDIGVGLMPPTDDYNWAFANFIAFRSDWRRELEMIVGRHVSLEPITPEQPGTAVVPKWVLLWKRL